MSKIVIGAPSLCGEDANEKIKTEFESEKFPLRVKITNLMPLRVVIPDIKLYVGHVCSKKGNTAIVDVPSYDNFQRAATDIEQLAEIHKCKQAIEIEKVSGSEEDPSKKVFAAILSDKAGSVTDLVQSLNCVAALEEGKIKATLTGTNLKKHQNGEGTEGYWIGMAIVAPEGANQFKINSDPLEVLEKAVHEDKEGLAIYWDNAKKHTVELTVQWFKDGYQVGKPEVYVGDSTGVTNEAATIAATKKVAVKKSTKTTK